MTLWRGSPLGAVLDGRVDSFVVETWNAIVFADFWVDFGVRCGPGCATMWSLCAFISEDGGAAGCVGGDRVVSAAVSGVGHALSDRGLTCTPRASGSRTIARRAKRATDSRGWCRSVPLNATHRDTVRVTVLYKCGGRRPRVVAPAGQTRT